MILIQNIKIHQHVFNYYILKKTYIILKYKSKIYLNYFYFLKLEWKLFILKTNILYLVIKKYFMFLYFLVIFECLIIIKIIQ